MTDPALDPSVLEKLYHSGAYLPLAIVVAFLGVTWASKHIAWLQAPNRVHYVSAAIAGLAILVGPATQGTTPNISMLIAALGTVVALVLPGATPKGEAPQTVAIDLSNKPPQAGRARLGVLLAIVAFGSLAFGCAWFKSEDKAIASDLVDCTKGSAPKAIAEFGPVVDALLVYATGGNGAVNSDAIKDAAKNFGKDVGGCVLADAVARALKPAATGSGAPKSSPLQSDPDSLRRALAATFPGAHYHTANGDL